MGRVKDYYQSTIPDTIQLKDGRIFQTTELMSKTNQNRIMHRRDARDPNKFVESKSIARLKYTNQETKWLSNASIEEIVSKYGCTTHKAKQIKNYVRTKEGLATD